MEKYRSLYNSVPTSDEELNAISTAINSNINPTSDVTITPAVVKNCIQKLKSGKGDGDYGFNSNHLINGTPRLYVLLSLLFNIMLIHGYIPSDLLKSTIISIPKDNRASLSSSNNYRGISLFNSICKVYDYVVLYLCGDKLQSSDMQFGFKSGHSTTMCSLVYRELIDYYVNGKGNVYSCLLDASKAFDRVHYGTLFRILIEKQIPACIIRLIFDSYTRQRSCILWNSFKSEYFSIANGVKQGGVISPILF